MLVATHDAVVRVATHDAGLRVATHDAGVRVATHDAGVRLATHDAGVRLATHGADGAADFHEIGRARADLAAGGTNFQRELAHVNRLG